MDLSAFDVFAGDHITVTRSEGQRTADGWQESGTRAVLDCAGDAQQGTRAYEQRAAFYEAGDLLFFAQEAVTGVQPGDSATVETEDGRTLQATVEKVIYDDDSLLLSFDE